MDVKKVEARQELGKIIRGLKHTITDLEIVINALREDGDDYSRRPIEGPEMSADDALTKIIREKMSRYE